MTTPPLDGQVVQISADGTSSSSIEVPAGHQPASSCGPDSPKDYGGSGAVLLAVGGRQGDLHYMAGLMRPGAKVSVTFHDGHTVQLHDQGGAFVVFFAGHDWPKTMQSDIDGTSCELQGDSTMSGEDEVC